MLWNYLGYYLIVVENNTNSKVVYLTFLSVGVPLTQNKKKAIPAKEMSEP